MTPWHSCDAFFFPDVTLLVPCCAGADGGPYMGQAGGVKTLPKGIAQAEFAAFLHETWLASGMSCSHIKTWKDVDTSWIRRSGRKSQARFVLESVAVTVSNRNHPGQICVSVSLPCARSKSHTGCAGMPSDVIPGSVGPVKLGEVVMKILDAGKRLMDEGRWDSDSGRLRE